MLGQLAQKIFYSVGFGKSFRKKLPLDYKKGNRHTHKNPHALSLATKDKLVHVQQPLTPEK